MTARLSFLDRVGAVRVRLGIGRMSYRVAPGLYGLGQPDPDSPALVTANYKLTFDALRAALPRLNAWILVLDTAGVNVWCAAGKGTFGTDELVERIEDVGLASIVAHREIVLPQLGAVGVAGHEVRERTGFRVVWGPVEARDLPSFLSNGKKATPAMRAKTFTLAERAVLVPMEVAGAGKWATGLVLVLGGLAWVLGGSWRSALPVIAAVILGVVAGGAAMPLLLPWLPGRAFSLKGAWTGLVFGLIPAAMAGGSPLSGVGLVLLTTAVSAFLALNFTGASTLTSLSGVRREMRVAVPVLGVGAVLGLAGWLAGLLLA